MTACDLENVFDLAKRLVAAESLERALGAANTPSDYKARTASMARYILAKSAAQKLRDEYESVVSRLTPDQLERLARADETL